MDCSVVKFSEMPWHQVGEFARQKVLPFENQRLRLLQLQVGFTEQDWCLRGHVGFVLQGALDIEFRDGVRHYQAGDGLLVGSGIPHKACLATEVVTLFLIDQDT